MWVGIGFEDTGDFFVVEHVGKAVGAKKDAVGFFEGKGADERFWFFFHSDVACDEVACGVVLGLVGFDVTCIDKLGDDGMVFRDLREAVVSESIRPAVAEVCDEASAFAEHGQDQCCAHVTITRFAVSFEMQLSVLLCDCFLQESFDGGR